MKKQGTKSPEFVRTMLTGLTIECPRADDSVDCPLFEMRKLSFAEKFEWIKSLPDYELLKVYAAHCECLEAKEETF